MRFFIDAAWAAGLFEGEGSFWIQHAKGHRYANACLSMTDEDVVRRFHQVVGVGSVQPAKTRGEGRKLMYNWRVSDRLGFDAFVALIRPHLGVRRLGQLDAVLQERTPAARQPNQRHLRSA